MGVTFRFTDEACVRPLAIMGLGRNAVPRVFFCLGIEKAKPLDVGHRRGF